MCFFKPFQIPTTPNPKLLIPNSFLHQLIHFLNHLKGCGTLIKVLFMHMDIVGNFFLGQMRKPCAISWPNFIYIAHISFHVEKLAWGCFIEPVACTSLPSKPFLFHFINGHMQIRSDLFNVAIGVGRCHCLTTIGAGQTIYSIPYIAACFYCYILQVGRRISV